MHAPPFAVVHIVAWLGSLASYWCLGVRRLGSRPPLGLFVLLRIRRLFSLLACVFLASLLLFCLADGPLLEVLLDFGMCCAGWLVWIGFCLFGAVTRF
jgi:hypothetical protein